MAALTQTELGDYIPVEEFFRNRSILVTGVTGFMGKALVEKLLRSCPGIKNIYVLMRPKRGQDISTRLMEITDSPLFDRLREERPFEYKKVIPIMGDLAEPELGISESDQILLASTVSIVFHLAATIKFNEALNLSVTLNVLATKRLVKLCQRMLGLKVFIHVSTAYCNCDRKEIKETIYPTPYDPEYITECMKWMDNDLIGAITPMLIGNRPNTYTFTKALTEQLLMKEAGNLPVAIVRPSIVVSSMKEPVAGWVDNYNGPSGLIAAGGKGILRTMPAGENNVADLIPVDMAVNLMIVAAWRTAAVTKSNEVKVYNCCSGIQNPITWGRFISKCVYYVRTDPFSDVVWYPSTSCCSNLLLNKLIAFFSQLLPAYLIDATYRLIGKKPIMVKIQKRLDKVGQSLSYFTLREWRFYDDNVQHLSSILSNRDKETFYFDVRDIDWPKYLENYVLGIRSFLFKEDPSSLPMARKHVRKLLWIHRFSQLACIALLWKLLSGFIDFGFVSSAFFSE